MEPTPFDVILRPVVTEKSMKGIEEHGKYTFRVDPRSTKVQIRKAIERIYKVTVTKVNTVNVRGKTKRQLRFHSGATPHWKKAIVTLRAGDSIELFDSVKEQTG